MPPKPNMRRRPIAPTVINTQIAISSDEESVGGATAVVDERDARSSVASGYGFVDLPSSSRSQPDGFLGLCGSPGADNSSVWDFGCVGIPIGSRSRADGRQHTGGSPVVAIDVDDSPRSRRSGQIKLGVKKRSKCGTKAPSRAKVPKTAVAQSPRNYREDDTPLDAASILNMYARAAEALSTAENVRVRAQGRVRSQRLRQKNRIAAEAARVDSRALPFTGLAIVDRNARKYTEEDVNWIIKVGTCPSAGAARAPLAGIIAHVSCEISRWSVDLYRWRICRYMLKSEWDIWETFLRDRARVLVLRFDETPMRLYVDGKLNAQTPTMIRCLRAVGVGGEVAMRAPSLRAPSSQSAVGLLGALDFKSIGVDVIACSDRRWKLLMVISDAAATNKVVARRLVAECAMYPFLLVAHGLCWSHTLSNSTKASLGGFAFGQWLRLGHILQAKPLRDSSAHCLRMLDCRIPESDDESAEAGRVVWTVLIRFMCGSRGPFGAVAVSSGLDDLVEEALRLFPLGPPRFRGKWTCVPGSDDKDYCQLVRKLFGRHPPMPICTRWYTVEQMAWYGLGLHSFSMVDAIFSVNLYMSYWPGEMEPDADTDPVAYKAKSSARVDSLRTYIYDGDFVPDMIVACISSLPRWRCAIVLETDGECEAGGGVAVALRSLLAHSRGILAGEDGVAEFFINREPQHLSIRARVWRSIATTAVYLADKNAPYRTPVWRVIRGEMPFSDLLVAHGAPPCCENTGLDGKISARLSGLNEAAAAAASASLEETLTVCRSTYMQKGGCDNVESERGLSIARTLGLKLHHRPPKMSTLAREHVLRHYLSAQRSWFDGIAADAFGGVAQMKEALRRNPTRLNAFTAFAHALKATPGQLAPLWNRLDGTTKQRWAEIARQHNKADVVELSDTAETLAAFERRGPLGSIDRRIPVDKEDILHKLHEDGSRLHHDWKRVEIKEWVAGMDKASPLDFDTGAHDIFAEDVLLPGDKCVRCERSRKECLQTLLPLRRAVYRLFKERSGRRFGLTVGLQWDFSEPTIWFDIVTIVYKPEKILAIRLEVIDMSFVAHSTFGDVEAPLSAAVTLPDVFDGRSMCLLDFCNVNGRGSPTYLLHTQKNGVASTPDGWVAIFPGGVDIEELAHPCGPDAHEPPPREQPCDFADAPISSRRTTERRRSKRPTGREMYDRIFGNAPTDDEVGDEDSDSVGPAAHDSPRADLPHIDDAEDDTADLYGAATLSESEIANHLRLSTDERTDLAARLKGVLDVSRYGIYISITHGVVTTYWKASEKNSNRRSYRQAVLALSKVPGARKLRASRSSLRSMYDFDICVKRAADWQAWHASWIYGTPTDRQLPTSMPLPQTISPTSGATLRRAGHDSEGSVGSASPSCNSARQSDWDTSSMSSTSTGTVEG